jgi:bacterioferritin
MDKEALVDAFNEDLPTEYHSIVQYVSHIATITGPQFTRVLDELRTRLTRELSHAEILAEQVSFLGGRPSTTMTPVVAALDANDALGRTTVSRYASWSVTVSGFSRPVISGCSTWPRPCDRS